MILSEINFFSESLVMRSTLNVILPQPVANQPVKPFRTLYLLHGHSDDQTAWQRWTSIERYVEGLNLAVVMPNVHRSFYTDMAHGGRYWTFVSEEVPALVRSIFPLSAERADNFVAGLSMGGYGAFKMALAHPERFAAAASLSGVAEIRYAVNEDGPERDEEWLAQMRNIFGSDLKKVADGPEDLRTLARQAAKAPQKPRLYQCCGTEDFLYQSNLSFRDFLRGLPFDLTYAEGPGEHNWAYWDRQIQDVIAWMTQESSQGI